MAGVDRNILRLATFEMMHREDIPPVVAINEAVDIAKRFSTDDSGKFVNGILDKLAAQLDRWPHSNGGRLMYADLHLHTNYSDGTYTPEELALQGHQRGLKVMALTDHDTVDGCERMVAACEERRIEFITGCEFTVELDSFELHLLGYFLDLKCSRLREELVSIIGSPKSHPRDGG